MEQNTNIDKQDPVEEIDLIELGKKLWAKRKLLLKVCGIAAVLGVVVAISIPKEYTTEVKLALERSSASGSSGAGALAALAGVNLGAATSIDELSTDIYPDVLASTPFLTGLFDVKVKNQDGSIDTSLYDYLLNEQKKPWWGMIKTAVFSLPGTIKGLFTSDEQDDEMEVIDPFNLTMKQRGIAAALQKRVDLTVDKKTNVMSVSVKMQDPLISAQMTDTILSSLQTYITAYKTNKANQDLKYTEQLFDEARESYVKAQQAYANYADANQNIFLQKYKAEQERLQNEMNLSYQIYSSLSQRLQMARAKVQEITPAFTVIQPAVVPITPSAPRKLLIIVGFVFLALFGSAAWVLFAEDLFGNAPAKS